jgi:hypothetical protein
VRTTARLKRNRARMAMPATARPIAESRWNSRASGYWLRPPRAPRPRPPGWRCRGRGRAGATGDHWRGPSAATARR